MGDLVAWSGGVVSAAAAQTAVPVMAENGQVWQLWQVITAGLALPGAGAFGLFIWQAWLWFFKRKDDNAVGFRKDRLTYTQELQAAVLAAGKETAERTRWLVEEHQRIIARAEEDKEEVAAEFDRWRRIAGHCYWQWRDQYYQVNEARAMAINMANRLKVANMLHEDSVPSWPPLVPIPEIESIMPRVPWRAKPAQGPATPL